MFSRAWIDCVAKLLFRVATAWIKNGQPKIVCAL
jgi:hypothetical protein